MRKIFRLFFRPGQGISYLISKIVLTIGLLISAISSIIAPLKNILTQYNVYTALLWATAILFIIQLDNIIAEIQLFTNTPFKKHYLNNSKELIKRMQGYSRIKIFMGFRDKELNQQLLFNKTLNKQNIFYYISPKVFVALENRNIYENLNHKISLSNVADDCITVLYINDDNCEKIDIIRPFVSGKKFFTIEIKNDTEFLTSFYQNYVSCYEDTSNSIQVNNKLLQSLLHLFHHNRTDALTKFYQDKNLRVLSRSQFFEYATELIKSAEKSLLAVDFIPAKAWIQDNIVKKYGLAHSVSVSIKKRIHIYNKNNVLNMKKEYASYIKLMNSVNTNLLFLDEEDFDLAKYERRGSLIIDDYCGIIAINPGDGAMFGEIELNPGTIKTYINRFNDISSQAIDQKKFISEFQIEIS